MKSVGEEFTDFIRGATRPVVTVLLIFAVVFMAIEEIPIPESIKTPAMLVLGFWFGERASK